ADNGDVRVAAAADYGYTERSVLTEEFIAGASAGIAGYGAGGSYGSVTGTQTNVQKRGEQSNANNRGAAVNGRGELASGQLGYSRTETHETESQTRYSNAQLDFGQALDVQAANGRADIGGGDLRAGNIDIEAARIDSTKYKDETRKTFKENSLFIGARTEAHSSIANAVNTASKKIHASNEGQTIDPGLTAGEAAGVVTDLIFNDTIGGSVSAAISDTHTESEQSSSAEKMNVIRGGNVRLKSTRGDIALNGMVVEGSGKVEIDAAGQLDVRAAREDGSSSSWTVSNDLSYSMGAGSNAVLQQNYVTGSVGYSGTYDRTQTESTDYRNSQIAGRDVKIASGGDTRLNGAHVGGRTVTVETGGNLSVESVQDTSRTTNQNAKWGANLGAAGGAIGGDAPYVAPVANLTAGYGESWDRSAKVKERSGIEAQDRLDGRVAGDTQLTGATLGSKSRQG
ncbi:hemagglutinin repeat-containing protein, partial [Comamonas sp. BIGb0124]|uniref:hemagglutinin repeat-containing protein n=1 Tax=Comamonas sp. BIGb0124 TaxID=2485130 RepID=UPI0011CDAD8A